jgi:tRNA (mo5U34)-methyltransferase
MTATTTDVESVDWYHTFDFPDGTVTRGLYDLRGLPGNVLPADLSGKRCLDACSATGFWAFEMEKRGGDVVSLDVPTLRELDWRMPWRLEDPERTTNPPFQIAKDLLGSKVERVTMSVYDVTPELVGQFDLVFVGSVLLHLRDPVLALRSLRTVTRDQLISFEPVNVAQSVLHPQSPRGVMVPGADARWWTPNAAAHRVWVESAGFEIEQRSLHLQHIGRLHPRVPRRPGLPRRSAMAYWLGQRQFGVLSQRLISRPLSIS